MVTEDYRKLSPEQIAQAEREGVGCTQCVGLSRANVESVAYHLSEVSTEALVVALEWRGFRFHLIASGPR
jgi:hypothetical protein